MFGHVYFEESEVGIFVLLERVSEFALVALSDLSVLSVHLNWFFLLELLRVALSFFLVLFLCHFVVHLSAHLGRVGCLLLSLLLLCHLFFSLPPLHLVELLLFAL